jgi:hypothetical protein
MLALVRQDLLWNIVLVRDLDILVVYFSDETTIFVWGVLCTKDHVEGIHGEHQILDVFVPKC